MHSGAVRDLRYAARALRRSPGFALAAVLTLALGIGATTAVFSIAYAVLLRPLPFPNADRLVQIVQVLEPTAKSPEPVRIGLTPNQFVDLQDHSTTLTAVGGYVPTSRTLNGLGVATRLSGAAMTSGIFEKLGVAPLIGRTFAKDDSLPGADPVVILSYDTWMKYFGGDRAIVGQRIAFDDTRPLVIGVMPRGFSFPSIASSSIAKNSADELNDAPEFWIPRRLHERTPQTGSGFTALQAFGMLRENATPQQALAETSSLLGPLPGERKATLEIVSARREMARRFERVLTIFQLGVGLILLIACVNVVNLLLTRAAHKRREIAIRIALGASRARITSESVAESVLLALAGGALGCLLAYALTQIIAALPPHLLPRLREIRIDAIVLLFALAVSVGTGIAVGLFAAFKASRIDTSGDLAQQALRGSRSSGHRRLRPSGVLVVAEIAATMVLLTGAGLLVNSFARLMNVGPGFEPAGAMAFRLTMPPSRYATEEKRQEFVRTALDDLRRIPAIESASATSYSLEGGAVGFSAMQIDGVTTAKGDVGYTFIAPDYFRTLRIPVKYGREFREDDRTTVATRAIVNDAFARRYFSDHSLIGHQIAYPPWPSLEVIGVVADSRMRLAETSRPMMYLPADARAPFGSPTFVVRTSSAAPTLMNAIRESVRRLDPQLAVYDAMTLEEMLTHNSASPRFYSIVSFWCAIVALLLAGIGLYGVLAYAVSTRTQEFGIRMALGANAAKVVSGVMRQGLALAAAGVGLGLVGAFYVVKSLDSLLFGLTPTDPTTFAFAAAMFVVVALAACYIPSRRATSVDVISALRVE